MDWSRISLPGLGPGRNALVSGATGALGEATARAFESLGMEVALLGRFEERLREITDDLGDRTFGVVCDISDPFSVDEAFNTVTDRFESIDVFVHCAAVSEGNVAVTDLTDRQIEVVTQVNVQGSLYLARAVARTMLEQESGRIVMVSSVAAGQAMPGRNVYGPTKAALTHLTRQLAVELGPSGITVNSVSPGQTPTYITLVDDQPGTPPRAKSAPSGEPILDRIPLRRRGELDDFVGPILFFASDLSGYTTGTDLIVDGGSTVLR